MQSMGLIVGRESYVRMTPVVLFNFTYDKNELYGISTFDFKWHNFFKKIILSK